MISIKKASELLGVTPKTLREWEKIGKIKPIRLKSGHRRYELNSLFTNNKNEEKITVCYARVSTNEQKGDLDIQYQILENHCNSKGYIYQIIKDLGSGLNYKKKGLIQLIKLICNSSINRLIITNKDRLLRFGSELIFQLCEIYGVEVIILNKSETSYFEEDLNDDITEIITVFSSRLYGSRSHKNKNILKELTNISNAL
jgi:predicted site-specific integrase-resolvase